jgi:DNA-binding response OmpR family regulator
MRILLVEDEPRAAQVLSKGLREQSHAVDVARDGDDALYQASITDYDAIVLDVMLPGIDGLAVCRELRGQGSQVPVLMLTAPDAVDARISGLDSGADDYLIKPFDFGELLARLRAVIRRGRAPTRLPHHHATAHVASEPEDQHNNQHETEQAAPVVGSAPPSTAAVVVATASAKEKHQHDNQKNQHGGTLLLLPVDSLLGRLAVEMFVVGLRVVTVRSSVVGVGAVVLYRTLPRRPR